MASSSGKLCGPCQSRHKSTTAVSWCMDCDDGLCSSCIEDHKVNKASKEHQIISVSQYAEIESVSSFIKQKCEQHGQKLTFYCLDHCVTACALCVPEKHKQCARLKPVDELARNAKTSSELFDIERGIKELDKTVDELIKNRQRNIDTIKDQQKAISRKIKSFRNQINNHLDKLESNLLNELESKSEKHISEINMFQDELKVKGVNIKSLGKTIHQIKDALADVQVFLATKRFGEKLKAQQNYISTICKQNAAKGSVLKLSNDPQMENLLTNFKLFGTIQVVRNSCQIKVGVWEQQRAQLFTGIAKTAVNDIDQIQLELIRKISFDDGSYIRDCVIVKDGRMIFANSNKNNILVYTNEGQLSKSISVDKFPIGLAVISTKTVAVSCRLNKTINIVNIDNGVVKQTIDVGKPCSGLSYLNAKLYVVVLYTGIMEFDLGGNLIKTIPVDVPSEECYLSYDKDMFCYTSFNNFISCCNSDGGEIWRLKIANSGVTVDNDGNYFASHYGQCQLQIISADGKRTKQLLDVCERQKLEGVFFDKNSSTLLVSCRAEYARLYRVIKMCNT